MPKVPTHKTLLTKLLATIVAEWGIEEVKVALDSIAPTTEQQHLTDHSATTLGKTPKLKVTAISIVDKMPMSDEKKEALQAVAKHFDRKEFLPSVSDIRQFIIMSGQRPAPMKDRMDGFRVLLRSLVTLPSERLQQIAEAASNSGPTQLGPISDAISTVSESLPRYRVLSDS